MRSKQKQVTQITSAAATKNALHSLDSLLAEIQQRRLILTIDELGRVEIWSPNTKLPIAIRRAVVRHNDALLALMANSDKRVCPNPMLHKHSQQRRADGVCRLCRRLNASIDVAVVELRTERAS